MRAIFLLCFIILSSGCASTHKYRFPVWYFPAENTHVIGIGGSIITGGLGATNSTLSGVRIEIIGPGILLGLAPSVPFYESKEEFECNLAMPGQIVRGLEISTTGTWIEGRIYGLSFGLASSKKNHVTGIVGVFAFNMAREVIGIQIGSFNSTYRASGIQIGGLNQASEMKGLQLGLINWCNTGSGLQIGLWNKNSQRSLPILNWTRKKKDCIPNQSVQGTAPGRADPDR